MPQTPTQKGPSMHTRLPTATPQTCHVYTADTPAPHPPKEEAYGLLTLETLYFDTLLEKGKQGKSTNIKLPVSSDQVTKPLLCKIDTGADGNVLPISSLPEVLPCSPDVHDLEASDMNIEAYSGYKVQLLVNAI